MNRIDRLHAILTTLQSKRIVKAEELARKFEVSLRTIYRDIRALEAGGVPIGAEAGIGYFITDGYHLPPVMFTKEEGRALLMAGKLMEKNSDSAVSQSFQTALTKVRAVLDNEKKDELQGLDERIMVDPFPLSAPEPAASILNQLKEALVQNKIVEVDYFSNYKGELSTRQLEPIGLTYYHNHWHLIAFCRLRQDYRDFRTDRMAKLKMLDERFKPFRHPSLKEYINSLMKNSDLEKVEIRVHTSIFRYIADTKYTMGLVQEEAEGDFWRLTFAVAGLDYFARWLLMMLDQVEVVEPTALREKVEQFAYTLSRHYEK